MIKPSSVPETTKRPSRRPSTRFSRRTRFGETNRVLVAAERSTSSVAPESRRQMPGIDGSSFCGPQLELRFGAGLDFTSDCVTSIVGRPITGPADLTRAELQQIFASCLQPPQ